MQDLIFIIQWWFVFLIIGIIFLPATSLIFTRLLDHGYLFSKVIGIALISYAVLVLGIFKLFPFAYISIVLIIWAFFIMNIWIAKNKIDFKQMFARWKIFIFEEALFLGGIAVWSYIRAHEPSINGLEKFMDFGFLNSILRTTYQPAVDMWYPPLPINYYYFGHLTTAVLTKLSLIPSYISYNLMIATMFSFTFCLSVSFGMNLFSRTTLTRKSITSGIITGALVSLSGNLHTIYLFFNTYNVDKPLPFWNLPFLSNSFPNSYWYPNATRFIPFTIHEFPIYSFVVSDLHGHVVDIMYVLLFLAIAYVLFITKATSKILLVLLGFLLAIMYMTNAWDSIIYLLLASCFLAVKNVHILKFGNKTNLNFIKIRLPRLASTGFFLKETLKPIFLLITLLLLFSLPFNLNFKPFAEGIGILCAPQFLTNIGRLGPFLFEADHCQRSALWQLLILYGFFYSFVFAFVIFLLKRKTSFKILKEDTFVLILIFVSSILILLPEFLYVKDIYPAHYRANTMFKLVYQAFIMLSLSSAYIIFRITSDIFTLPARNAKHSFGRRVYFIFTILFLILVFTYPYFAIKSYYGDLKTYSGLSGIDYMKKRLPQDYEAIRWINKNIQNRPTIVEAQGDSYTDYARISANTGLPTVLGWTVHEWLWRGSYDIPSPRIEDVRLIYESNDLEETKKILKKHNVEYVYLGNLEREKYTNINETKFEQLGKVIFETGQTKIYKLANPL